MGKDFDVVITSCNSEKNIRGILDSLQKQTHQNFECYVVDDNSEEGNVATNSMNLNSTEVVYLSGKNNYTSKNEIIKIISIYGFIVFCLVLVAFYILRKI